MKKRFLNLIVLLMSGFMIFTGCGSSDSGATSSFVAEEAAYDAGGFDAENGNIYDLAGGTAKTAAAENGAEGENDLEEYTSDRKIVYSSSINIETKNFDEDIDSIKKLVQSNGGYYEYSSVSGSAEYGGRYANYTARIPSGKYQDFMESVGSIGSVTSRDENVEDITSSYVDVQARLKSLRTKLARLEELEANAETVEDLLNIEDRINDVQYEIENYTAQLKLYDDKVDYCTVSIHLNEVVTYTEVKADTFWNRITEAFGDSISGFISFIQGFVIGIVYVLPYIVVAAIIALIVLFFTRKKRAKAKEKKKALKELETERATKNEKTSGYNGPVYPDKKN